MKKIMNKLAGWSSSKKAMWFASAVVLIYAAVVLAMNNAGRSADSDLTTGIIEFCKWLAGFSATIGTAKIIKGKQPGSVDAEAADEEEGE